MNQHMNVSTLTRYVKSTISTILKTNMLAQEEKFSGTESVICALCFSRRISRHFYNICKRSMCEEHQGKYVKNVFRYLKKSVYN